MGMAPPTEEEKGNTCPEIKRKQRRIFIHDRVEVRSMEEGLLGSWHEGEVVGCNGTSLCVRYGEALCDDGSGKVSPLTEEFETIYSRYRGNIRPLPPKVDLSLWSLHYGKCVDVLHQDAWWEGVIFDYVDGSDVRKVFFPDMGDEMSVKFKDMRATQEWDEVNREWKIRCDWLFLELIEELGKEWPLLVSVKQIWYDLRADQAFQNIMEWTNNSRQLWKDLLLQVIFNNHQLTAKQVFQTLDVEHGCNSFLGFSDPALNVSSGFFETTSCVGSSSDMIPWEPDSLDKIASSVTPSVQMDVDPICHALDNLGHRSERNSLVSSSTISSLDEAGCFSSFALSVSSPREDHKNVRTKYSKIQWLPAGKDLIPTAEYCPQAIIDYANNNRSPKDRKMLALNARKHLSFLGWKIEFSKGKNITRMRYTSPENVVFLSLIQVCLGLGPESAGISSISEADTRVNAGAADRLALLTGKPHPYLGDSELMCESQDVYDGRGTVEDLSFEKTNGKLNPEGKGSEIEWLPAGKDIVPGAECCPGAITEYTNSFSKGSSSQGRKLLALNVRKHLFFLGWKIEFSRCGKAVELRYISPKNVVYYSLLTLCQEIQPESAFISPIPRADQIPKVNGVVNKVSSPLTDESQPCISQSNSLHDCIDLESQQSNESTQGGSNSKKHLSIIPCSGDSELITQREYVHVEDHYCPQAVVEYVSFRKADSGLITRREYVHVEDHYCPQAVLEYVSFGKEDQRSTQSKNVGKVAKGHLSAVGWKFFLYDKKNRKELRYEAPCGKLFISLRQACVWYVQRLPLSTTSTGEVVQKSEGLMAQTALGSPPVLDLEGNLTTHDGFSANQFTDSSLMPSLSKGLNGAIRTQENDVLQRKRMQDASRDSRVLLRRNDKIDLLGLPEKVEKPEHFIKQTRDVNPERRAKQAGIPSARQTPSTILSWLIDGNVVLPGAKVYYRKKDGTPLKGGRVTRAGIICSCCQCVFTMSKFEAHAGSTCHRPAANIFLEDGRSIRDCQLKLKSDKSAGSTRSDSQQAKDHRHPNSNDQICSSCRYGGGLLLCDQCPSAYHKRCLGLKEIPDGDWFCPSCCCSICNSRRRNENAEPNIGDQLLSCAQCERQYHMECLRSKGILKHDGCTEENWFCNDRCEQIHAGLQKLLGKPVPIEIDNLTCTLLKYTKSEDSHQGNLNNDQLMESYSKLNVALGVMHECFEPVKEPLSGRDLVEDVIFSRWSKLSRLNFKGFYTMLLEKDEQLVTVATMRVYGEKVAEIPLVATRFQFRRQGMCRILMDEIEKILMKLGVQQMVLPSASSVLKTWTNAFGFSVLSKSERLNFLSYTFLEFQGTVMCHKLIKKKPCVLSQIKESQQNVCEHMNSIDSMDVEGGRAVSEVFQVDGAKVIEMIQRSSGGIVCKSGNDFVPSAVMVHTDTDSESEETTDDDDPVECYKRRKVPACGTYMRKEGKVEA